MLYACQDVKMTNSHSYSNVLVGNVYKNMTDGQFSFRKILTNGHFCAKIVSINKMTVGHTALNAFYTVI